MKRLLFWMNPYFPDDIFFGEQSPVTGIVRGEEKQRPDEIHRDAQYHLWNGAMKHIDDFVEKRPRLDADNSYSRIPGSPDVESS